MITALAVGLSVVLFFVAALDQALTAGNLKVAALYACFALTNAVSLWIGVK
jgi:hypothetical protein